MAWLLALAAVAMLLTGCIEMRFGGVGSLPPSTGGGRDTPVTVSSEDP